MIIGAGWRNKDKNGKQYLSVVVNIPLLGELSLLVYVNENKKGDTSPDYTVNWLPPTRQKGEVVADDDNEDIPF